MNWFLPILVVSSLYAPSYAHDAIWPDDGSPLLRKITPENYQSTYDEIMKSSCRYDRADVKNAVLYTEELQKKTPKSSPAYGLKLPELLSGSSFWQLVQEVRKRREFDIKLESVNKGIKDISEKIRIEKEKQRRNKK